jgi:hypothetical protein
MCGRVYIRSTLNGLLAAFGFADRGDVGSPKNNRPDIIDPIEDDDPPPTGPAPRDPEPTLF